MGYMFTKYFSTSDTLITPEETSEGKFASVCLKVDCSHDLKRDKFIMA